MPFAQAYTIAEIRATLDALAEGRAPNPPAGGVPPPAHTLGNHWAIPEQDLKLRSCGAYAPAVAPGPPVTSCFKDFETTVLAVHEAINSAGGQAVLAQLDGGAASANTPAAGVAVIGNYPAKSFVRVAPAGPANPNGSGNIIRNAHATGIWFRVYRHVQAQHVERLWIQTAYPCTVAGGAITAI